MQLPDKQQAAIKTGKGEDAKTELKTIDVPKPGPGQILVKVNWTGLCASDKSLIHDEWAPFGVSMQEVTHGIAGHEGAGTVAAIGDNVPTGDKPGSWNLGDRAGIKWIATVCGTCEMCRDTSNGSETLCPNQTNSGFSAAGTFQEYCLADARYTTRLPEGVSDEEVGPLMCGGVTAYTALKRSQVKPGQWIVLPGAGGGLGHLAVQYAKAMGMRPIAIDGGDVKKDLCIRLGAEQFIDFQTCKDIPARLMEITGLGAHGVVVTAASRAGYESAPNFLRPGGTMVAVGLPADPTVIAGCPPLQMCLKRLNVVGSVVGTLKDVDECLDFTKRGLVRPILTKGTLKDLDRLCGDMKAGKLAGRAVLKIAA
ncbi:MAG: hypothetical protein M1828_006132 [Chrysothrix sp. TS-e1954]|nr:MAG: hypothetical protein M1828_006132 [Chrysothrix sp. TS-e1954]